jgi:hypothetical protein
LSRDPGVLREHKYYYPPGRRFAAFAPGGAIIDALPEKFEMLFVGHGSEVPLSTVTRQIMLLQVWR